MKPIIFSSSPKIKKTVTIDEDPELYIKKTSSSDVLLSPNNKPSSKFLPNKKIKFSQKKLSFIPENRTQYSEIKRINFNNNDWYEGKIEGNVFTGEGKYYMSEEKLLFTGWFKNGEFDGKGLITDMITNREVYNGNWKEGKKHGEGIYRYSETEVYQGEWMYNQKHGYGSYTSTQGQYKGSWKNDLKHGKGLLVIPAKGVELEGIWENNELKGGNIKYKDRTTYEGTIKENKRDGYGQYQYNDNSKYYGQWRNDEKNGPGNVEFYNRDKYEGGFKGGNKHGTNCRYRWRQGSELKNATYIEDRIVSGSFYDVRQGRQKWFS